MLNPDEEFQLESKLQIFEKETSNELAIVTVPNLGEMEVGDFAFELSRKWNIGKASKRNGVLLLVAKEDRKVFIAVSDKLQGALTDGECGSIIRNTIVPNFRAGRTYDGLSEASDNIIKATQGEFTNDEMPQGEGISIFSLLFILLIFGILFFAFMYSIRNRKNIYVSRRGYKYDDEDWTPRGGGIFGGGFSGGSFGGNDSGSSGGGFGGFGGGGGGFDGGGAGGSW